MLLQELGQQTLGIRVATNPPMELKTEPFIEELVTDLVIGFPSGAIKDFVLKEGDSFKEEHHQITVTLGITATYPEVIKFAKAHIAWFSVMDRMMRRVAPKPETA